METARNNAGQFLERPANAGRKKGQKQFSHKSIALAFKEAGIEIGAELVKHYQDLVVEDRPAALALLKILLPYVYAAKRIEITEDTEIADDLEAVRASEAAKLDSATSEDARAA